MRLLKGQGNSHQGFKAESMVFGLVYYLLVIHRITLINHAFRGSKGVLDSAQDTKWFYNQLRHQKLGFRVDIHWGLIAVRL